MMHEPRRFVPRVDFITSPGYLDGTPEARERAGLPAGTGPWRIVTSKALFGFDDATHELTLLGVLEGLGVEGVIAEMSVKPRMGERVERLVPPSPRELEILRDEIDPARTIIGRTAKS
jgi:glutaconate CoA-transferase subunit B